VQERLAAAGVMKAIEVLQDLADIVNTDPNEIVRHVKDNCRNCRGKDYAYQWIDAAEFARALDAYGRDKTGLLPMPVVAGGFGYEPRREPNHACPFCYGEGTQRVIIADTTKLSPKALKLIKNIKQDRHGVITVELYDKMQARDMILKMLGAYKADGKGLPLTGQGALDGISNADLQDPRLAADAYIRMLAAPT
jgi:phage terminase small subunit